MKKLSETFKAQFDRLLNTPTGQRTPAGRGQATEMTPLVDARGTPATDDPAPVQAYHDDREQLRTVQPATTQGEEAARAEEAIERAASRKEKQKAKEEKKPAKHTRTTSESTPLLPPKAKDRTAVRRKPSMPAIAREMFEGVVGKLSASTAAGATAPRGSAESLTDRAYDAIKTDDVDRLQKLVADGLDPDSETHGSPLLVYALRRERESAAQCLIGAGANLNVRDFQGVTPLSAAIPIGLSGMLIGKADVNQVCEYGKKPLHVACELGKLDVVEQLVEAGARLDAISQNAYTPLHVAVAVRDPRAAHALTEYLLGLEGIDVNQVVDPSCTPLVAAIRAGNLDAARMIVKHPRFQLDPFGKDASPLLHAACGRGLEATKFVFELLGTPLVDCVDDRGETPLFCALIRHGTVDRSVPEFLLAKGADIDARNKAGDTALHVASRSGNWPLVKWLVEHGASLTEKSGKEEMTAFGLASANDWPEVVKVLIAATPNESESES